MTAEMRALVARQRVDAAVDRLRRLLAPADDTTNPQPNPTAEEAS
ncbi:hypothetical protein [Streptomyces prasinopilosus]|nr:hypothetical protein [Streptomyces prasinopilosus]